MFKINRKLEYALIALKYMSSKKQGQLTSAKEICDIYHAPFDPTSRVLQIMAQHNILKAEHGAHGGYHIIKDLSKISLAELTDLITGPIEIANCFHGDYSHCEITSSCSVIGPMLNLNMEIRKLFKTIMITDLVQSHHQDEKAIKAKPIAVGKALNGAMVPDKEE